MAQTIDQAFITSFNQDVHLAYQRHGSKLRGTIRTSNDVIGETERFQKIGKGEASQKTRHGNIPPMNVDHSFVDCPISDWFGVDYVDDLDKLKINIREQEALQKTIVSALARRTDAQIVAAAETSPNVIAAAGAGMTRLKMDEIMITMGELDVPDDGQRVCVVGWKQWADMMNIDAFVNSDYTGPNDHPLKDWPMRKFFNGIWWCPWNGLTRTGANRRCIAYHWSAVGHAIQQDVETEIAWIAEKHAWLVKGFLAMGAVAIDTDGILLTDCQE